MNAKDRLPRWVTAWLCVGTAIVLWDVSFVLLRPASLPGGPLAGVYRFPYATYIGVDLGYGDVRQPFVWAQAIMSLLESFVVAGALAASSKRRFLLSALLAFSASTLTCAKTALILLIEVVSHGRNVGHNALGTLIGSYLVPNGVWIIMPLAVAISMGRALVRGASPAREPSEREAPLAVTALGEGSAA